MSGGYAAGVASGVRETAMIMILIVGGLATVATVAAFFGGVWWGFDLAASFRWHLLWISLAMSIAHALGWKGFSTIVFAVAAIVNAFFIAPLWLDGQPSATGEDGIRVVQANLDGGVDDEGTALRWLFDTGADLLVVSGTTGERIAPLVADGSPYVTLAAPSGDRTGIAVLGTDRWEVSEVDTADGQPVIRVSVPSGTGVIEVIAASGTLATSSAKADQLESRLAAVKEAADATTNPVVVVGSLGATRWTSGIEELGVTNGLRDATAGAGYSATAPVFDIPVIGGWIGLPVDLVLMTPEITPLEYDVGPDIGADHLPVRVVVGPSFSG